MHDIGIIGGGIAGYSAAIRAKQRGMSVVLFEKSAIGGVCLNKGCIPTKTILRSADFYAGLKGAEKLGIELEGYGLNYEKVLERKNSVVSKLQKSLSMLINSYDIEIIPCEARILSDTEIESQGKIYQCKDMIIATGSKPSLINGLEPDGEFIFTSDELLGLQSLPESVLIVGSGAIGVEWARIFSAFGSSVTIVEAAPRLLPAADVDVSSRLERIFKQKRIKFFTDTKISDILAKNVSLFNGQTVEPSIILVAAGRTPVFPDGLKNAPNAQIVGDASGEINLAHAGSAQGVQAVEQLLTGQVKPFDKSLVPSVIYGSPEIAWVGKREEELQGEYKKSIFPVAALGKAHADGEIEGFVKLLAQNEKIVGCHIISKEASSMINTATLAIASGITVSEFTSLVFPHPTYGEALFESALGLESLSLSMMKEL